MSTDRDKFQNKYKTAFTERAGSGMMGQLQGDAS
jgi:hypothetical protein